MTRHFSYKIEIFFREIIIDGPLRKTKCYVIGIKFQERSSAPTHSFIWIFNASNIENETAYIDFIKKKINVQLLNH